MRILHFGRFVPKNPGGIERHVDLLLTTLAARGVDCVNLVANESLHTQTSDHQGYRIVRAASFGVRASTAVSPALVWQALRLHRAQPFDVVHAHFPDPLTHLALALLPAHLPKVITWHSDLVPYPRLQKPYLPLLRRVLRRADALVAATPAHLRSLQIPSDIAAHKKHVIPYGMDFSPFEATPALLRRAAECRARAGLGGSLGAPDGGLVFALGRHVAYKGFDVLIRAMTQLPGVGLVLGGTGPLWAEHLALVQSLGLQNRVYLPGRIEDADLPAWYHACDVFCLPSVGKTEAFGLVQLEAMACSKPVVCTALGNGVNDINQHGLTGLAATPGDPAALSGAIRQLLSDAPLRAAMGAQAHQRAVSAYSLDAMAQPMLKLYEALAGPRSHLRTASGKTSA